MESQRTSTTTRRVLMATAALALVFSVSACGKATDKLSEKIAEKSLEGATGGDIDIDGDDGSFSIKTEDGEFSSKTSQDLPDDWPSDILPIPGGMEIANVTQTKVDTAEQSSVYLEGSGDLKELLASYADGFEDNDVEIAMQSTAGNSGMVIGTKGGNNYNVNASVDEDGALTLILTAGTGMTDEQ